ncbi:pyruvate dehydrogenase (acetyl-transferring) E1 component subunit alpha [Thermus islandicus]|uniref:pyruvate dehydrogenase (acetyl-transferring) E1 component subunit alpha n=1 Tax=Thermus islandicus TaxID=540988 RepID=UPI0003B64D72|nr:pyruvate dehydrogenase (acetyl-transferring) E1 component subunit alpha [Thermus islandicus]
MKPQVVQYLNKGEFPLGEEEALRLYRAMRRARFFDEKALTLQRQGRLGVYAPFMGQEAAQVGVALALGEGDWVVPSYRESAMLLAKGLPLHTLILYWRAHPAGWRFPEGVRAVNPYIPIATQIPQAVGLALAGRYRGEDWVVATSIGDGGTSKGDFHEGLNFAAVLGAPVVFLVQNNGYAISVPRSRQMKVDYLARRAEGYGMPGVVVDGNDAFAVYLEAKKAVERARKGEGPTLLEALTYRLAPHTTSDDPSRYRPKEEEEAWRAKDPILRLRKALEERGLWDQEREQTLLEALEEEFARELALTDQAPEPRPEEIVEHVYAEMGPDQRRAFEALKRGFHLEEAW